MIFSTSHQLNILLIFVFFGAIFEIVNTTVKIFLFPLFKKKLIKIIKNTIIFSFFSIFFVFLINFFNYGNFSLSLLLSIIIGKALINLSCNKTFVVLQNLWYTMIIKIKQRKNKNDKSIQN